MRALVFCLLGCASTATTVEPDAAPLEDAAVETLVADTFVADTFVADTFVADTFVADTPKSTCPADMVPVDTFCIDRYEAPNVAGEKPLAFQTAFDGEAWCKARSKRLCSEAEWVRACQGTMKLPYPYGATYKRSTCNDDKTWKAPNWTTLGSYPSAAAKAEAERLYQADPSGWRASCVSEDRVMDLTGNVAEWVTRSFSEREQLRPRDEGLLLVGLLRRHAAELQLREPRAPRRLPHVRGGLPLLLARGMSRSGSPTRG